MKGLVLHWYIHPDVAVGGSLSPTIVESFATVWLNALAFFRALLSGARAPTPAMLACKQPTDHLQVLLHLTQWEVCNNQSVPIFKKSPLVK